MNDQIKTSPTALKLGTFSGVFTPSVLTILGIILFLRLGYVVGAAGTAKAILIIALANLISVLTSVSLSAVATNLKVKGGGDYYLISRTLGLEFGGAIGIVLFLAQSVSIAFYCIGFGEAIAGLALIQPSTFSPRFIAAIAMAFLFILAWMGADWATRFQYLVMTLLVAALVSFFAGGLPAWDSKIFAANWSAPGNGLSFWLLFALFFPAVTGFTQGVSMSGDLKDPGKSLPLGTFSAVGVSILVYFGSTVLFSGVLSNQELVGDYAAMKRVARFSGLIDAGVIAATLSSAMASFLGAPRIFQSLASDRIFPLLSFFAKGSGPANNPRRAVLLAACIGYAAIWLGNLDLIAPVVSMFFLISYGLLNYATYYEGRTASPSFRPTFKWFDIRLSLLGAVACLLVMLAVDPVTSIIAISILFAIFQYLRRKAAPARWADSSRAHHLQRIRVNLLAANVSPEHPRDWRPQILAFSQDPDRRSSLLRLAAWLEGGSGLTTVVTLLEGKDLLLSKQKEETETRLHRDIMEYNPAAFPLVLTTRNSEIALHTLLQAHGIGPLRPNTILLNWPDPKKTSGQGFRELLFGRQLKTVYRLGVNIAILYADEASWGALMKTDSKESFIDVWWLPDATGNLMLLFAYLMTRSDAWESAALRVLVFRNHSLSEADQRLIMQEILQEARIDAELLFVESKNGKSIIESSAQSTFVFLPFRFRGNLIELPVDARADELLQKLPPSVMILAGEDIDLGAEPEEGIAAQLAEIKDLLQKKEKLAEEAEKEGDEARLAADSVEEKLRKAREKQKTEPDEDLISRMEADLDRAMDSAEKARRRAAKARVKAEDLKKQVEEQSVGSEMKTEEEDSS
ncbi:MAG: amino acid permease [Desulfobacterales bacterium]